ncbi:SDR family oxidoreductase [Geodermatophilus bullaregiensis]|uniref:SDR family oxidoreductase n=1 Tax=Geodermatophilus bullaregiensis TaxID=1564160 RepID=UPI0035590327
MGATGQLGHQVVRQLRARGRPVRAVVRRPAAAQDVAATGAGLVAADLREPGTLDRALAGVRTVVATADVVTPTRAGDTHAAGARSGRSSGPRSDSRRPRCRGCRCGRRRPPRCGWRSSAAPSRSGTSRARRCRGLMCFCSGSAA